MLNVTLLGQRETIVKLERLSPSVIGVLQPKVKALTLALQKHVQADKLSGQVLNVRTGNLRRSIHYRVEGSLSPAYAYGWVFSDGSVKYAGIHEFGGVIHHPARERVTRLRLTAKGELMRQTSYGIGISAEGNARAEVKAARLANLAVFARRSHTRVRETRTEGKAYDINMPERSYLRSSLRDQAADISTALKLAALEGARKGMGRAA